ncbi:MAG: GNAT family N-acetyltransferase [Steroidobacteraceae bacterium]
MASPYNISVVIDEPNQKQWEEFHHASHGAWEQAWAYGEAMRSLGSIVRRIRASNDRGETIATAQILERRFLGYLGFASCSLGPTWSIRAREDAELRRQCLLAIRAALRNSLLYVTTFTPEFDDSSVGALEEYAHFRKVMTGLSTVVIDLKHSNEELRASMETRWRNRLSHAERHWRGDVSVGSSISGLRSLLRLEDEQRRTRKFTGLPVALIERYVEFSGTNQPAFIIARANQRNDMQAAMLFVLHADRATYHIGWANEIAKKSNLHNLLLWRSISALRERGVTALDLGVINTQSLPGISRFKLGTGGRAITLPGTYL